jgi:hypothetical protein
MSMCGKCGAEMKENAKYCKACGSSLSGGDASLNDKKARVMTREKQWVKPAAIAAVVVLVVAALWLAKGVYLSKRMGSHPMFPPHRDTSARLMKAMDGNIRTAFDACVACNHAKLGYRQEGSLVVCNNCGMGFKPTEIGMVSGGCNPIPVNKSVDGQMIVLKAKDLEAGAQYF